MSPKLSLAHLLRSHLTLASSKDISTLIAILPFSQLRAQLEKENLPFPKGYAAAYRKLQQLLSGVGKEQGYKIKEGNTINNVSLSTCRTHLEDALQRFQEETFFKRCLAADIDLAFVTIQNNQDAIALYAGMEDSWVKEALRELRSKNRKLENELALVLQLIVSQVQ